MMEFAPATDVPYRRLPPLQMIHGQPVLDLDTPPPSSTSSPVTTPRDTKSFKKSILPQFSNEEINHSLHILQQCFANLEPGHLPCLKSHGRVSSAFGHNKYSISLARLYGRLADLRVEQAKLLFSRDCVSRLSQLIEFIQSLQSLVQDEERTLVDFLSGKDSEPHTKLEFLPIVCEELRLHLNHIPSIQHRLHTDRWLQPVIPYLIKNVHKFDNYLRHLQQSAICWLHTLITTGFKVYSYFHVSMLSQELLKNIVSSVEDFNRSLKQFQSQLSQHPCGASCVCNSYGAIKGFSVGTDAVFKNLRPFKCQELLEWIASCRAEVSAFRTFYFIMANSKLLTSLIDRQDAFDWKVISQNKRSPEGLGEGLWLDRPRGRAITRNLEINFAAVDSPLCGLESAEEEFIVKFLSSAATSSGLLQKLKIKRLGQSKDDKDASFVESISVQLVTSLESAVAGSEVSTKKSTTRFKRNSLARKSVRWGDSLNAQVKQLMLNVYFNTFWKNFGVHLCDYFLDPCVGAKGDVDVDLLGSTLVWDDSNLQLLLTAIQKYTGSTKEIPQRLFAMFSGFCTDLYMSASTAAWDEGFCRAQGSSLKDKCLLPYQTKTNEEETTATCHFYISSLIPVMSLLSSPLFIVKATTDHSSGEIPGIDGWVTRKMETQLVLLDAAITTLVAMETWCKVQSFQFLSAWKIQQFLLITQGDLKIVTDHAVRLLKISSGLLSEIKSSNGSFTSIQLAKTNQQKTRLENLVSLLHGLSSWSSSHFAKDCQKICEEFWPQAMPLGKEWRRKTTNVLPSEPNQYAELAINTLLRPVTEGVSHLKATTQITVVSIATTKMLDTWMNFILKEKPKFSLHGACQLEQDLNHMHEWLASCDLKPDCKQSILALDAVRNFHAAVHLLKFQPPGKLGVGLSSSKDELTSEYSVSTAPSDSQKDTTGGFDSPAATYTPPVQRARGARLANRNSDPGRLDNQDQCEAEEDIVQLPRKKEWLSLRVHQGNRWKLSFNCLNNNQEDI